MEKVSLKAQERNTFGKKVKNLRKEGILPGHVFGNNVETEHVSIQVKDFMKVYEQAGETGLIDLKIGEEKVRPVMVKEIQYDANKGLPLHIDFYQVNLKEKVRVPVPIILQELEEEIESVKMGEAVILQVLSEVEVEALPTDLIDQIEVSLAGLKNVDDTVTVGMLNYNHATLTVLADPEEVVVKLAPAVTEEMKALLEEQEAEAAAAQEATEAEEGKEEGEAEESQEEEGVAEEEDQNKTEGEVENKE